MQCNLYGSQAREERKRKDTYQCFSKQARRLLTPSGVTFFPFLAVGRGRTFEGKSYGTGPIRQADRSSARLLDLLYVATCIKCFGRLSIDPIPIKGPNVRSDHRANWSKGIQDQKWVHQVQVRRPLGK